MFETIENEINFVESNLQMFKMTHFVNQLSICGKYYIYKLYIEDKVNNQDYCIKVNKRLLQKLLKDILIK